jgi:hypothetical protein
MESKEKEKRINTKQRKVIFHYLRRNEEKKDFSGKVIILYELLISGLGGCLICKWLS